ncbi:hypothetical protein SCREM2_gp115 [Synechococcus phage S-CREM2]|nr:hypothetical protein SCREM2_gp115 [Synechococcus phage S-CREM2]
MALQNSDYFLVNRAGAGYRLAWSELQSASEDSLQIQDVFSYTGSTGATTSAATEVPINIHSGIRLPVAGTGDYTVDGAIRYSPSNSKIELYYGGAWNTASGGTAFSASPPVPATEGDIWYDTDNGRAYVYYNDGDSSQWVELNPAWDGGVPPGAITGDSIADRSIAPIKLTVGGPDWNSNGYGAIGQTADANARFQIRSLNSGSEQKGLQLTQGNVAGSVTQNFSVKQDGVTNTSTIEVNASDSSATSLVIEVGGDDKLVIPSSGNITTAHGITATGGFVGNLTGNVTGYSEQLNRVGVNSSSNSNYRLFFGEANNTAGPSNAYVVTNASRLYYNPSTDKLTVGTVQGNLQGTADNATTLANLPYTEYIRSNANAVFNNIATFNEDVTFNDTVIFNNGTTRFNDNKNLYFGNDNDSRFIFNGSHFYTDLKVGNWYIRDNTTTKFTFGRSAGSFTATGTITAPTFSGNLSGNATTATDATNSTNINVAASSTNANHFVTFTQGSSGNQRPRVDGGLLYNPSTNQLSVNKLYVSESITGPGANLRNLADNEKLYFGTGNDVEYFFNGSNLYTDLKAGNYFIRDGTTTRFTFGRAAGSFTATGTITAPTFSGNLTGNATSATSATSSTNADNVKVDGSTSTNLSLLLGSDTGTGYKRSRRSSNLYWAGSSNTLNTTNLTLTGTAQGGTYKDLTLQGTIKEEVHTITWSSGFAINPSNGSFQLVTLGGSSTPTQSNWDSGESITLMIASPTTSYSISWATLSVKWAGGDAPNIPNTGYLVVQLWKINSDIYGALVGDVV